MRLLASLAVLLASAMPTVADEARVSIPRGEGEIVGTMETGADDPEAPLVLTLHGFTASRDELPVAGMDEGVSSKTARKLAEAGIPSLRIDLTGS